MEKIAIYPGSFDMFTIGHLSVLEKAYPLFDKIIVCISHNPKKKDRYTVLSRIKGMKQALEQCGMLDKVSVVDEYGTSIPAEIAEKYGAKYIIRGIRNVTDFVYEEELAAFNKVYDESIETIYFRATNSEVSSSMVSALVGKKDIGRYLPYPPDILTETEK